MADLTKEILELCEARREIQNVVGKYSFDLLMKEEAFVLDRYWSGREDICLAINEGWFVGSTEVARYYEACVERTERFSRSVASVFPEEIGALPEAERFGVGTMDYKPLDTGIIEVAEDGETAKGLWYCRGTEQTISKKGLFSCWTWGYLAADFIYEDDAWKIWHLQYLEDVNALCGTSWTKPRTLEEMPDDPAFAGVETMDWPPEPTICQTVWERYHPLRGFAGTPRIPEPYGTFGNTFSYGM